MPTRRTALRSGLTGAAVTALAAVPLAALTARPASATSGIGPAGGAGHAEAGRGSAHRGGDRLRLTLPAPTGPYAVGTRAVRLVDHARPDPWGASARPYRELMISVRYPAGHVEGHPLAPQLLPGEADEFAALDYLPGIPADRIDWAATRTHAHQDAPPARTVGGSPVVLYSPGAGDPRSFGTTLCDDLASRGYTVVSIDHTYDAYAVQFPGERVEKTVLPAEMAKAGSDPDRMVALLEKVLAVRVADTRFVLDALPAALPRAVRAAVRPGRVGMFGQSAGGFAALQTMHDDRRITAGANLDGVLAYVQEDSDPGHLSSVAADGLDRPFLLVGKDGDDLGTEPAWAALWRHSTGWRRGLTLRGAAHASYTDLESLVPQIVARLGLPAAVLEDNVGTLSPGRAITAGRSYLAAFFDRWLRDGDDDGLLDGPSRRFPEARFFDAPPR
ncbi:alpha/beta hydrolase [Streptomyces odontomachi]|uniref:alpha/beta hydrolase n=1 Tax=Streptomyces odontomachi TaxID=2944940 RepID=UPI00210A82EC|nr:hydrolase [Streptomyces sp. ODS25]